MRTSVVSCYTQIRDRYEEYLGTSHTHTLNERTVKDGKRVENRLDDIGDMEPGVESFVTSLVGAFVFWSRRERTRQ